MSSIIPWRIREAVRSLFGLPAALAASRRFSGIRHSSSQRVQVGFGGVLEDGRPIQGGAVKLLPLRSAFGGSESEFHILYAVSSSPPQFAERLFAECQRIGIRIVWNQNGVGYPAWAGAESERFNEPMRRLRSMADFVVFQSEFCKLSASKFLGPSEAPSMVLYNPVDLEVFHPESSKTFSPAPLRLLAAGTHGTRDRLTSALEALCELRKGGLEAVLTVAGRFHWPDGERDFSRETVRLGLRDVVRRIVRFSQADAPQLYRSHDLLIHPKYMDPCPTVALEAMASGLPVVGSRSGGMPELVSEDCGILIDAPQDWVNRHTPSGSELAAAVAKIHPKLPDFARSARRNAEAKFAVGNWLESHGQIFQQLREL